MNKLPMVVDQLPMDTFYMSQINREAIREALESMSVALKNHHHIWSPREAEVYARAITVLS